MANLATVNFNGANGAALSSLDANWAQAFSSTYSMEIYNNRVRGTTGAINPAYIYNITMPSADYAVSADFYVVGTTSTTMTAWIFARQSSSAVTRYAARWRNGTGWQLFKYVAGTATQLGSTVAASYTAGTTKRAKLVCNGSAISLYVDDVLTIGPITDTAITGTGYGGILVATDSTTDGVHLDNFSIDTLSSDGTAPAATLTGTASIAGGGASGSAAGTDGTAPAATLTGTGTVTGGGASATVSGSFTFAACENNTQSGVLNGVAVNWAWHSGGAVGAATVITNGSGTITSSGMTVTGLPTGPGYGVLRTTDGQVVAYQEGTVA